MLSALKPDLTAAARNRGFVPLAWMDAETGYLSAELISSESIAVRTRICATVLFLTATLTVSAAAPDLETEQQRTLYAIGLATSANLATFSLSAAELEVVKAGIADGVLKKQPKVNLQTYLPQIEALHKTRLAEVVKREQIAGRAYADKAAQEPGVSKIGSGILYSTVRPGTGESPTEDDTVKVRYEGKLVDGSEFDSSLKHGQAATVALDQVIRCWREALQRMKVGEKVKLVCPSETAYGERGLWPQVPPGATLLFDVELLEVLKNPMPRS